MRMACCRLEQVGQAGDDLGGELLADLFQQLLTLTSSLSRAFFNFVLGLALLGAGLAGLALAELGLASDILPPPCPDPCWPGRRSGPGS